MKAKIITVLELAESERIRMRKIYTSYFRATGRRSVYLMDPVIVLGGKADISRHIPLSSTFHLTGEVKCNEFGSFFAIRENDEIERIERLLNLEILETGLHLDMEAEPIQYPIEMKEIRIRAIASALLDEHSFRILYRKKLAMGI